MASRTLASKILMTSLEASLSLVSTIGNGSFIAIFARFKNLRSFPNILFVNLAACFVQRLGTHLVRGKTLVITLSSLTPGIYFT